MIKNALVITRHTALVEYLRAIELIDESATIIPHCDDPETIRGRTIVGPIPISLACVARSVIHIPLRLDPSDRGRELSLAEVRERAGEPTEYVVRTAQQVHDEELLTYPRHVLREGGFYC